MSGLGEGDAWSGRGACSGGCLHQGVGVFSERVGFLVWGVPASGPGYPSIQWARPPPREQKH